MCWTDVSKTAGEFVNFPGLALPGLEQLTLFSSVVRCRMLTDRSFSNVERYTRGGCGCFRAGTLAEVNQLKLLVTYSRKASVNID